MTGAAYISRDTHPDGTRSTFLMLWKDGRPSAPHPLSNTATPAEALDEANRILKDELRVPGILVATSPFPVTQDSFDFRIQLPAHVPAAALPPHLRAARRAGRS